MHVGIGGLGGLVALGLVVVAGCSSTRDPGSGDYRKVTDWVCCIPREAGALAPTGWCECASRRPGVSVDCSEWGVSTCPATPHCVVQGAGDTWSCACADNAGNLPTGTDVYQVERCPP